MKADGFNVDAWLVDGVAAVTIAGLLDAVAAPALDAAHATLTTTRPAVLIISEVEFIASTAVRGVVNKSVSYAGGARVASFPQRVASRPQGSRDHQPRLRLICTLT